MNRKHSVMNKNRNNNVRNKDMRIRECHNGNYDIKVPYLCAYQTILASVRPSVIPSVGMSISTSFFLRLLKHRNPYVFLGRACIIHVCPSYLYQVYVGHCDIYLLHITSKQYMKTSEESPNLVD